MFQLIVVVIGIMLFAIMVLAAMYFGGSAHTEASIRAEYAGNMNAAAQIEGALQLYYQDHAMPPPRELSDAALLEYLQEQDYLKEIPAGDWRVAPDTLYKPIGSEATLDQCIAMNRVAGFNLAAATDLTDEYEGCPPCNGAAGSTELQLANKYKGWPGCQFVVTAEEP